MRFARLSLAGLSIVALGCANSASDSSVSASDCRKVRKHQADLRVEIARAGSKLSPSELAKHAKQISSASPEYIEKCIAHREKEWVECMLAAKSIDELSRCES